MTLVHAFKKVNDNTVFFSLQDRREKRIKKTNSGDFVRTADTKEVLSEGDATNWSFNLYKRSELIQDTIPS